MISYTLRKTLSKCILIVWELTDKRFWIFHSFSPFWRRFEWIGCCCWLLFLGKRSFVYFALSIYGSHLLSISHFAAVAALSILNFIAICFIASYNNDHVLLPSFDYETQTEHDERGTERKNLFGLFISNASGDLIRYICVCPTKTEKNQFACSKPAASSSTTRVEWLSIPKKNIASTKMTCDITFCLIVFFNTKNLFYFGICLPPTTCRLFGGWFGKESSETLVLS